MKTRSSVRRYCLKNVFRLCLCLVVCGTLALAGATAFLTKPAYACTVVPAAGALPPATECQNYNFGFTAAAPGPLCASMCGIITGLPPGLHAACGPLNANTTWYTITGTPNLGPVSAARIT